MQTTFGVKETAERLGISQESVRNMERDGKLHRLPLLPGVRYSAAEVSYIETYGVEAEVVTAWKHKQMVEENRQLKEENTELKRRLCNIGQLAIGG